MKSAIQGPRHGGFTLIEVLVVIGILTLLVVAFAPSIFGALTRGEEVETRARLMSLQTMCEAYARVYGEYPPDDFSIVARDSQAEWNLGNDNGKNSGIESLVMHLSWEPRGGGELDQLGVDPCRGVPERARSYQFHRRCRRRTRAPLLPGHRRVGDLRIVRHPDDLAVA